MITPKHSATRALRRFGFKQSLKGALIIGLLSALMIGGQGAAYTASYPDEFSRTQFKSTLQKAPALGVLYGEIKNLPSPAGYMVYRTVSFLTFIISIWGLMTVIKLLRGQEEDGKWELIASGSNSSRKASLHVFLGFILSVLLAFILCVTGTTAFGALPSINAPPTAGLLISLSIFLPTILFGSFGFLVSQLSTTRRRALMYGLIPLIIFFIIRTIGNIVTDLHWLKYLTPFGWSELVSPVINPAIIWLLPATLLAPVFIISGFYLINRRDLGVGIIKESTTTKSHFFLLSSHLQLAIRQNSVLFISWALGAFAFTALMAEISGIAAEAVGDSDSLKNAVGQIGGSNDPAVGFIGAGLVFMVMLLLVMATVFMASIRATEAKNQLDTILVNPIRRSSWLVGRLSIIIAASLIISIVSGLITWALAQVQNISLDLSNLILISIALNGTIVLTLGIGTLIYGLFPKLSVIGMYLIIGWSFLLEMVGAVIQLDDVLIKSSLFHYVSISPTQIPDWSTFWWLIGLGVALMTLGVIAFTRRDIISE